jgi:hypothetical protein
VYQKPAALFSALAAFGTWFGRGTIESWFFGHVIAMTPEPTLGFLVQYGPPTAFAILTFYLMTRGSGFELPNLPFWVPGALVPIDRAARLAFEAAERAGVVDLTSHPDTAPEERLRHYIYTFMVDDETLLLGAKPPSMQLMPIPRDERFYPVVGKNQFDALTPQRIAYTNVKIRHRDLRRIIREYPRRAREFATSHGFRR